MADSIDEVDIASLYTVNEDGSVTYQEGLAGSWLALAEAHYLQSKSTQLGSE